MHVIQAHPSYITLTDAKVLLFPQLQLMPAEVWSYLASFSQPIFSQKQSKFTNVQRLWLNYLIFHRLSRPCKWLIVSPSTVLAFKDSRKQQEACTCRNHAHSHRGSAAWEQPWVVVYQCWWMDWTLVTRPPQMLVWSLQPTNQSIKTGQPHYNQQQMN